MIEVSIILPARTYGHSKMTASAALQSARYVFQLYFSSLQRPEQFLLERKPPEIEATLVDPQNWNDYWEAQAGKAESIYGLIAGLYRRGVIKRNLNAAVRRAFAPGSSLLHAGCGSGQVDTMLQHVMRLTAIDISPSALHLYARNNPKAIEVRHGSIFDLPYSDASFDGVYNLGVLEHFTHNDIGRILGEFHRVLRPGGKVLIFWPHRHATSVLVLKCAHFVLNRIMNKSKALHPPEISLLQGRSEAEAILERARFTLLHYEFGIRDCYVQATLIAKKKHA